MFRKWQFILKIIAVFVFTYSFSNSLVLAVEMPEQKILTAEMIGAKRLSNEITFGTLEEKIIIAWLLEEPAVYSNQQSIDEMVPNRLQIKQKKFSDEVLLEGKFLWKASENLLATDGKDADILLLHREAWRFYGSDKFDQARLTYEKIPAEKRTFWVFARLGELWVTKDSKKANFYYKQAYQVATADEKRPDLLLRVATVFYLEEDYNQAISLYTEALKNKKSFITYLYRGNAYFMIGDIPKAIDDYSKGIEMNSTHGDLYINRARAYADSKQNEKAIGDYKKYLSLKPKDAEAWQELIKFLIDQNGYENARSEARHWVEMDKNQPQAWNIKGVLNYNQKRYEESLADFKMVTQIDPTFSSAWYYQALTYEKIGFPDDWPIEKKWEQLNLIKECYIKFLKHSDLTHPDRTRAEKRIEEINKYSGQILDI